MIEKVAAYYKISVDDLKTAGKERKICRARSMVSYFAVRDRNVESKNPSPVKETGFPLQLTLATPLPFLICEIRPEVLRPTLSSGLPFQVPSERSNESIGRYAKTFRNIYDLTLYRFGRPTAILCYLKKNNL